MRLSQEILSKILQTFDDYLCNDKAKLYLYGSRVDDQKKGGDIDLLLVFPQENESHLFLSYKNELLAKLKLHPRIGDQKIDLVITNQQSLLEDPFLKSITPTKILLKEWPNNGNLIEFSKEIRGEYGASIPGIGLCSLLAFLIGTFIFRNSHLLDRVFEFSDRSSIMMFLAVATEALLAYHLYRISTVKVKISSSALEFSQLDETTTVKLDEVKSVKKRGAVIILVTNYGEKKLPHFGMFGEFGLAREFEALGLLNKETVR